MQDCVQCRSAKNATLGKQLKDSGSQVSKDAWYCFYVTLSMGPVTSVILKRLHISIILIYYLMQFTLSWRWHSICYLYPVGSTSFRRNYVRILSVEAFFGKQRAAGGHSDNPTVQQFCQNTVSLSARIGSNGTNQGQLRVEGAMHC